MAKLTKRIVEEFRKRPRDREEYLWDGELKGFGARFYPSGRVKFEVKYRTRDSGTQRKLSLGAFGPVTVERARELAQVELGKVAEGADPSGDRRNRRAAVTVAQLCDRYLEAADAGLLIGRRGTPKKASTIYVDRGRIERHIKPLLGALKATEVTLPDIERFRDDVVRGKTAADVKTKKFGRAIVEGGKGTATRTLGLLGAIFAWGRAQGYVTENPVRGVRRFADKKRKAYLELEQYRALGAALDHLAAKRNRHGQPVHHRYGLACIRFIALSGVRLSEAAKLKWHEARTEMSCLALDDSKTGHSVRPLGQPACELIERLDKVSDYVFAAQPNATKPYQGLPGLWGLVQRTAAAQARQAALDEGRAPPVKGPLEGLTLHSLRHSYAGVADELELNESTVAALLGHAQGSVTSGYILKRLDPVLISTVNRVSTRIDRRMHGEAAEIVPFDVRRA